MDETGVDALGHLRLRVRGPGAVPDGQRLRARGGAASIRTGLAGLACVSPGTARAPWPSWSAASTPACAAAGNWRPTAARPGDARRLWRRRGRAALRERGLPLLVHASEPVGHEYPGKGGFTPEACCRLAAGLSRAEARLRPYGRGALPYEMMPEVREALADVYYDTAAVPYLYGPGSMQWRSRRAGPQKLIFGSDYPSAVARAVPRGARTPGSGGASGGPGRQRTKGVQAMSEATNHSHDLRRLLEALAGRGDRAGRGAPEAAAAPGGATGRLRPARPEPRPAQGRA